jgi:cellulose synthase/poly-beta-1,6-N-acetylglucosamine synthase-like glycosyltransferase
VTDWLGAFGWAVLALVNSLVLLYFVALNAVHLTTSLYALATLRRYSNRLKALDVSDVLSLGGAPPISVIAPAYNEELTCVQSVRSLLTLEYPTFEVLVVNDGSRDATLHRLTEAFELVPAPHASTADLPTRPVREVFRSRRYPNLWVIDKENGGKADALNAGLNYARTPLFCAIDADSILEREALARVVRPFLEDDTTVAAGGTIRIANGCTVEAGTISRVELPRNLLAKLQVMEYLRAFLGGRVGWDAIGATLIISGAFGLFRRSVVVAAGGFDPTTVGEDMELVVRLHRHCVDHRIPYRIRFVADPVAWTECPESLRVLGRQRERWQRGLTESLLRHRSMLFNPRYGRIGLVAMPYYFLLEMVGPLIELLGYLAFGTAIAIGAASSSHVGAFLLLAFALGIALSLAALGLEELTFRRYPRGRHLVILMGLAVLEAFGFRQLSTYWRTRGLYAVLRKKRGWGEMTRHGFNPTESR